MTFLFTPETVDSIRAKVFGYAATAKLIMSNWIVGGIGNQLVESFANVQALQSQAFAQKVRGVASLDSSVDPGDVDPYNPANVIKDPVPGDLTDLGTGTYGTARIDQTFATGPLLFTNQGAGATQQNVGALALTFQRNYANPDGSTPTYRNQDPFTCAVGQQVTVTIVAESPGSINGATSGSVDTLVNTLPGVTVANTSAVLGTDRQPAETYREACREAAALTAPNGPADAYRYLATTGRDDGTWGNSTTGNSLGVTGVYVSQNSATGIVVAYYRSAGGTVSDAVVTAVNNLIAMNPGVIAVPDAITFSGQKVTPVNVVVTYSVKAKATNVPGSAAGQTYTTGGSPPAGVALLFAAIDAALATFGEGTDINGFDAASDGTGGVLYTEDIRGIIRAAWPTTGGPPTLYDVAVTSPSTSTTAVGLGGVIVFLASNGTLVTT